LATLQTLAALRVCVVVEWFDAASSDHLDHNSTTPIDPPWSDGSHVA
jgi:hypothetical protein